MQSPSCLDGGSAKIQIFSLLLPPAIRVYLTRSCCSTLEELTAGLQTTYLPERWPAIAEILFQKDVTAGTCQDWDFRQTLVNPADGPGGWGACCVEVCPYTWCGLFWFLSWWNLIFGNSNPNSAAAWGTIWSHGCSIQTKLLQVKNTLLFLEEDFLTLQQSSSAWVTSHSCAHSSGWYWHKSRGQSPCSPAAWLHRP